MSDANNTRKTGKTMALIAWILGMLLLIQLFGSWEDAQFNPNSQPASSTSQYSSEVLLRANRQGHYITSGSINSQPATFLIDTGATDVVVPQKQANRYKLSPKGEAFSNTANGVVKVYKTTLDSLSIGGITLYNVPANINPGMDVSQPILLGMSALKNLEINQNQGELKLIKHF